MWKSYRGDSRGRHRDRHHAVLLAFGLGSALAAGASEHCAGVHIYALYRISSSRDLYAALTIPLLLSFWWTVSVAAGCLQVS